MGDSLVLSRGFFGDRADYPRKQIGTDALTDIPIKRTVRIGSVWGRATVDLVLRLKSFFDSRGRRGVRLFGISGDRLFLVILVSTLLGLPLAVIIAMAAFWDRVGAFGLIKQFNSYSSPAIESLTYQYRDAGLPRFPVKRFFVASESMIELIFLGNFFALFLRTFRRHALLVWICYDQKKLFYYLAVSGLVFGGLWFVLFSDWAVAHTLASSRKGSRFILYFVLGIPIAAFVFGHMASVVGLGMLRTASRRLRRL